MFPEPSGDVAAFQHSKEVVIATICVRSELFLECVKHLFQPN